MLLLVLSSLGGIGRGLQLLLELASHFSDLRQLGDTVIDGVAAYLHGRWFQCQLLYELKLLVDVIPLLRLVLLLVVLHSLTQLPT